MRRSPIDGCPQPDAPTGQAIQYPVTELCYWGTFNARRCLGRDAVGAYWVGAERFARLRDAFEFADSKYAGVCGFGSRKRKAPARITAGRGLGA